MPLAITDIRGFTGVQGRAGTPGADSPLPGANGAFGTDGGGGQSAVLRRAPQTFTGDAGNDSVLLSYSGTGGRGGVGGDGGDGRVATVVTTFQSTPTSNSTFNNVAGSTDGGFGGRGGTGGRVDVVMSSLVFDLTSTPGGADVISLAGYAVGGVGAAGGLGGFGGPSGGTAFSQRQIGVPGNYFTEYETTSSAATGTSGPGGISGVGGRALVAYDAVSVSAAALTMRIDGLAVGGEAADGVNAMAHPNGAQPAAAFAGGAGAAGGWATARVDDLTLTASVLLDLQVTLEARGGLGGDGGVGGAPSSTTDSNLNLTNGVGTFTTVTTYATAGNGGRGGAGGAAFATFTDAVIAGAASVDLVDINLRAIGGVGGRGGGGQLGFADRVVVDGNPATVLNTWRTNGTPDGSDGVAGINGRSTVTLTGNVITLGGGNDRLELILSASGTGARVFEVENNRFDGGAETDTLSFGDAFSLGQPNVVFNVAGSLLRVGAGISTMTGFERFEGGAGRDRFIDAGGNQTYVGRTGIDRYDFVSGRAGHDRIEQWNAEDVVAFWNFANLRSLGDLVAASTQRVDGVLVQTSATSSVLIEGAVLANLQANDFIFI